MNGDPITGSAVFGEAFRGIHPGDTLRVEVQSPGEGKRVVNIRLTRVVRTNPFTNAYNFLNLLLCRVLSVFALALGFWGTAARPYDGRAWLLLAFLLSFAAVTNPGVDFWAPGLRDYGAAYQNILVGCFTI